MSGTKTPNCIREHLVMCDRADTAVILDALYSVDCTIGKSYTVQEIMARTAHLGISERLIRTGLRHWIFWRTLTRPMGGRPAIAYRIPSPRQVRDFLGLYDASEIADSLPLDALKSVTAYKMHLHAAMIARLTVRNGGKFKMARAKMAERLRVSVDTIRNYEKQLPITVQPYISQIKVDWLGVYDLPPANKHDHRYFLSVTRQDGTQRRYPFVRAIAIAAMKAGHIVHKCKQHSNFYSYFGDVVRYGLEAIPPPQPTPN